MFDGFIFHLHENHIFTTNDRKKYKIWKQIKVNGNQIWFLLIPLILSKWLCVDIVDARIDSVEITQWMNIRMFVISNGKKERKREQENESEFIRISFIVVVLRWR